MPSEVLDEKGEFERGYTDGLVAAAGRQESYISSPHEVRGLTFPYKSDSEAYRRGFEKGMEGGTPSPHE